MELVLRTRHQVAGDGEENELVDERLLEVDLDVLVRENPLTLDEQCAHLRFPNDVPPVLTVLDHILDHLVVVAFELVVLLIREQPQRFDPIVESEYAEVLVDLLEHLLYLQDLLDVNLDVLGASWLVRALLIAVGFRSVVGVLV